MEEERQYYDPRFLPLQYWMQQTSAWFVLSATSAAEWAHCSAQALGLVGAYNHHRVHLHHGQRVHMSQGGDNDGHGPREEQQPEQLPLAEQGPSEARRPQQRRPRRSRICFKQWEVRELESLFQFTQYPDVFARLELARELSLPECRVKSWFKNRRAKHRKLQREAMLSGAPPAVQHQGDVQDQQQRSPVPLL